MGMVLAFAALAAFFVTCVVGAGGVFLFVWAHRRGRASVALYVLVSCLLPLVLVFAAVILFQHEISGAPTGADYERWLTAAVLFGIAPGSGLFVGGVGMWVYSVVRGKSPD